MFRLFSFVGLTALSLSLAASAQGPTAPPMTTPPTPGSDAKPGAPVVAVALTKEIKGEKAKKIVPDPLDSTKSKEVEDPHYSYDLKKTKLAKDVKVLPGTVLVNPVFPVGAVAPKGFPVLTDGKFKVETTKEGILTLEEEIVLSAGTSFDGIAIKSPEGTLTVYVDPVAPKVYVLPTGAPAPTGTKLADEDLLQQLDKARELAKRPTVVKVDQTQAEFDAKLANAKEFQDVKKGLADLKQEVAELKVAIAKREEDVNKRLDTALAAATGKADQTKLDEVNALLAQLGEIKTAKANLDKIAGLEADVAKLKAPAPATTTPTTTGDTWIQKCYTGGTVPGRVQENGSWYRFHSHASGNNYWYIKE